jgi:hypothetical protein
MKLKTILITAFIIASASVNAKWIKSDKDFYYLMTMGAEVIDISPQGYEYPKIITTVSYLSKFYRCISWIPDAANPEPRPEKCFLLKPDN